MPGLLPPSSAHNWLNSHGSSSGLIVKRTIRVDIPVDKYPNVWMDFLLLCDWLGSSFLPFLMLICCYSITLLGASLGLGGTLLNEWKQILSAVFSSEAVVALRIHLGWGKDFLLLIIVDAETLIFQWWMRKCFLKWHIINISSEVWIDEENGLAWHLE